METANVGINFIIESRRGLWNVTGRLRRRTTNHWVEPDWRVVDAITTSDDNEINGLK